MKDKLIRFLRSTEKYTKTDMVYLFKSNFWMNINKGLNIANGLILSVAFANLLTKEDYGTYAYVLAIIGIFSMPLTTGLGAGMSKSVSRGGDAVVFEGLRILLPWSVGVGIVLGLLGSYYLFFNNIVLGVSLMLGGLLLPFSISNSAAKSFINSRGEFEFGTKFAIWRTPIMTVLLVTVMWISPRAISVIVASMIGNFILGSLLYIKVKKHFNLINNHAKPVEPFAKKYALHSAILSIFNYLAEKIDSILLWKFLGAAPVATYIYAIAPIRELKSLIENQSLIALPKFAQKEFSQVVGTLPLRIKQTYLIAIPVIILYTLFAPFIFQTFFPQYIEAVIFSQIASLSLLSTPRRLISVAISAHQKIKESYIMTVVPNLLRIILACISIPLFGIKGAIAALLISEVIDYGILGVLIKITKSKEPA